AARQAAARAEPLFLEDRVNLDPTAGEVGGNALVRFGRWSPPGGLESRHVAVKTLSRDAQDDSDPSSIPQEIRIVLGLRKKAGGPIPNLVEYLCFGYWDEEDRQKGKWSVVMPFAPLTLEKLLSKGPGQSR